jgi:hypothetical protein
MSEMGSRLIPETQVNYVDRRWDDGTPVTPPGPPPRVYAAIAAITAAFSTAGIAKNRKNTQQGYNFRGIDDVYNALSPLLVQHRLLILPRVEERTVMERQSRQGGTLIHVTVKMTFDLVSAEDGSRERVSSFGEAMDSGDKATNKALSTAYRYMAMQVFCIPTVGTDPEQDTYEVAPAVDSHLLPIAREKALTGMTGFRGWYIGLTDDDRLALRPHIDSLQEAAKAADRQKPDPLESRQ